MLTPHRLASLGDWQKDILKKAYEVTASKRFSHTRPVSENKTPLFGKI
jgi:hypothetical protein